jgi:hypothetical protein
LGLPGNLLLVDLTILTRAGYCKIFVFMRKTRTIMAVTLLATALCADRSVTPAAQVGREEAGTVARGFAQRLTVSLRRVVPAVKLHQSRQERMEPALARGAADGPQAIMHGAQGTPFQFRLPPPLA